MGKEQKPITENIRVGFDQNAKQYVVYEVGDNFPYCYSRIASFGRECDALEWYKRVTIHETLKNTLQEVVTWAEEMQAEDIQFIAQGALNQVKGVNK